VYKKFYVVIEENMIIAVDGTSGSGKSTLAKLIADKLRYKLLNTSLLYKKITKECLIRNISYSEVNKIVHLCNEIEFNNISKDDLHNEEISIAVPFYSQHEDVREQVRIIQRILAKENNIVVEGRDIGTVVFPEAEIKFYIDATLEERARRRLKQIGTTITNNELRKVMENIEKRDNHDLNREYSPLKIHKNAFIIDTTNKKIDQVMSEIMEKIV